MKRINPFMKCSDLHVLKYKSVSSPVCTVWGLTWKHQFDSQDVPSLYRVHQTKRCLQTQLLHYQPTEENMNSLCREFIACMPTHLNWNEDEDSNLNWNEWLIGAHVSYTKVMLWWTYGIVFWTLYSPDRMPSHFFTGSSCREATTIRVKFPSTVLQIETVPCSPHGDLHVHDNDLLCLFPRKNWLFLTHGGLMMLIRGSLWTHWQAADLGSNLDKSQH